MIRTAVDTSILIDVFSGDERFGPASLKILEKCWQEGLLIACDIVWAEIRPRFQTNDELLETTAKIQLSFEPTLLEAALKAGEIWKVYKKDGGRRERMIPDFLIAAHALLQADRLLTRDRGFTRRYFQSLQIVEP